MSVHLPSEWLFTFARNRRSAWAGIRNERIVVGKQESRTLAALRDTLLPKLISGELRVEDPARFRGGGRGPRPAARRR